MLPRGCTRYAAGATRIVLSDSFSTCSYSMYSRTCVVRVDTARRVACLNKDDIRVSTASRQHKPTAQALTLCQ